MSSYNELPKLDLHESPPAFGHSMLKHFCFADGYINLNHGSDGSLPAPVLDFCIKVSRNIEASPDKFDATIGKTLRGLRERVAPTVGAHPSEVAFIPNTTHGIHTILHNISWHSQDIILLADTTYGAIKRAVKYVQQAYSIPTVSIVNFKFPATRNEIIEVFRERIQSLSATLTARQNSVTDGTKLKIVAVVDAISSNPGIYFPWKEMVNICRAHGIITIVDAAHAIGQEPEINLSVVQPDFWVSSCHKWLYTKRGCAILYVPSRNQHLIKSSFPVTGAYDHSEDSSPTSFAEMFTCNLNFRMKSHYVKWLDTGNGTIDHTPYISIHAALDFRAWLGGESKINDHCHALAVAGGTRLAEILGSHAMDCSATGELTLNMCNVKIPVSARVRSLSSVEVIRQQLLFGHSISTVIFSHNDAWWVRCCAQVWNELSDFEYLGRKLNMICKRLEGAGNKMPAPVFSASIFY